MVRKYYNHTYLRHSLTYKTKCNILSYSFLKKWVALKRTVWWLYYHKGKNLGAGASTGATTTGIASHSPLLYSYSSSHWDVEGWMVCLRIPILRRMRCGGKNYPPQSSSSSLIVSTFTSIFASLIKFSTLRLISNIF